MREAKGDKDRIVPLPERYRQELEDQIRVVEIQHAQDMEKGAGSVYLPIALAKKYPSAQTDSIWQYVFTSSRISVDPHSGVKRRHHLHESSLQKAVKRASIKANIKKNVSSHVYATASLRICWKQAMIFVQCRSCWGITMWKPR